MSIFKTSSNVSETLFNALPSYIIGFLNFLPVFFRLTLRLPRKLHLKNPTLYVKIQPQIQPPKKRENP